MSVLDNIKIVLVGTLYTGNVGSACRAMANMGFHNLVLAAPNLQNDWSEGERMAEAAPKPWHAKRNAASWKSTP